MQIRSVTIPAVSGLYATDHANRVEKEEGSADARERRRDPSDTPQEDKNAEAPADILELSHASLIESDELEGYAVVYTTDAPPKSASSAEIPLPGSRLDLQA